MAFFISNAAVVAQYADLIVWQTFDRLLAVAGCEVVVSRPPSTFAFAAFQSMSFLAVRWCIPNEQLWFLARQFALGNSFHFQS